MYNYKIHMSMKQLTLYQNIGKNSEKTNIFFGIGRVFLFTIEFPRCMTRFFKKFCRLYFCYFRMMLFDQKGLGVV